MWVMSNTVNPQFNPFINSIKNNSFDFIKSFKQKKLIENYSNKNSPFQFGFNFFFDNIKSSPFTPINSIKGHYSPKNNNIKSQIPILFLFKSSLEKSGYNLSYQQIINKDESYNDHNNINSFYEDINYINHKTNYPMNNNNIINNIYPTFNKVTNVKILTDSNIKNENCLNDKDKMIKGHFSNLENKKEIINYNILNIKITEKKDNNSINKEEKDKDNLIDKKAKILFECSESKKDGDNNIFLKKKRLRKNRDQISLLSKFYLEHKIWSKKEIKKISENIGLKENKIYKWLWDQRNKEYKATKFVVNKNNN